MKQGPESRGRGTGRPLPQTSGQEQVLAPQGPQAMALAVSILAWSPQWTWEWPFCTYPDRRKFGKPPLDGVESVSQHGRARHVPVLSKCENTGRAGLLEAHRRVARGHEEVGDLGSTEGKAPGLPSGELLGVRKRRIKGDFWLYCGYSFSWTQFYYG